MLLARNGRSCDVEDAPLVVVDLSFECFGGCVIQRVHLQVKLAALTEHTGQTCPSCLGNAHVRVAREQLHAA